MKKTLCVLLLTAIFGGLYGQSSPAELAQIEFTLLGKMAAYNRLDITDSGSTAVDEIVDIEWNQHRKIVRAKDSLIGVPANEWTGSITGNSNTVSVTNGSQTLAQDVFYWDSQFRDTLLVSYMDTNNDGTLDKSEGQRFFHGPQGVDSLSYVAYTQSGTIDVLNFKVFRNGSGQVDSIEAIIDFFGFKIPSLTYRYVYSGNMIMRIDVVDKFGMGATLTKLEMQNNAAGEITTVNFLAYDSLSSQWLNSGSYAFGMGGVIGQEEMWADAGFGFYPNPAKDWIELRSQQQAEVEILSLDGRSILKTKLSETSQREEISNLPAGPYLIRFSADEWSRTYKFIKE